MVKVGILSVCDGYNTEDWFINTFTFSKVKEHLFDNFTTVEINDKSEVFNLIGEHLQPDEHTLLSITDLYYCHNYVYQAIYKSCEKTSQPNMASQLVKTHGVIGPMLLIKRELISQHQNYVDFVFNDLHTVIYHTFVHNAVIIDPDNKIQDFPYITDVLESTVDKETFENIRYHEYKFLDYTMMFYCNISSEQTSANLNTIASTIYRKRIYGRVYITLVDNNDEHPQSVDLTKDLLEKIYFLHGIEEEVDKEKHTKKFNMEEQQNFPQINYDPNFYTIVYNEYQKRKDKQIKTDANKFRDVLNEIK